MDRVEYSATIGQLFIHHLTAERPQSRGDVSLYGMLSRDEDRNVGGRSGRVLFTRVGSGRIDITCCVVLCARD